MRGCLLVRACGCSTLDGKPYHTCEGHKNAQAEGGGLKPVPQIDEWLKRQREKGHPI